MKPSTDESIEFEDERSRIIHSELKSKDNTGDYASFYEQFTNQFYEEDVNTAPPNCQFTVDLIAAIEIYTASDKERIRRFLVDMARRMPRNGTHEHERVVSGIDRAVEGIANDKLTRSLHNIDGLVVPVKSRLFETYKVSIQAIGPSIIKVYYWLTPTERLQEQAKDIARKQTNTRVKIVWRWFNRVRRVHNQSFIVKKGNSSKRELIKRFDDEVRNQVYKVIKREAPGILAANYSGVPVLIVFGCRPSIAPTDSSNTEAGMHKTEFFKLLGSAGADNYRAYESLTTGEVYIEQKLRSGNELEILGKFIAFSSKRTVSFQDILWINTLKEVLKLQSRQLDILQNQVLMLSMRKTRKSLASQRLQLYQHLSVYETFTSVHDQEQEFDKNHGLPERSNDKLIWDPLPGQAIQLKYHESSLKSIELLRSLIDSQIPKLKESYLILKDEFSDRTVISLQRWAICLAIIIPLSQIGLQRCVDIKFPVSEPSTSGSVKSRTSNLAAPAPSHVPAEGRRASSDSSQQGRTQSQNNKVMRTSP